MRKILFLTFLIVGVTSVQAEWVRVENGAKRGEKHYFDPEPMQKQGHFRKVWMLSSYEQKQPGGYRSVKSLYELDCREEKARSHTMLLYADAMAATGVIGARHDQPKDWFSYTDHSILGHIAKTVCQQ